MAIDVSLRTALNAGFTPAPANQKQDTKYLYQGAKIKMSRERGMQSRTPARLEVSTSGRRPTWQHRTKSAAPSPLAARLVKKALEAIAHSPAPVRGEPSATPTPRPGHHDASTRRPPSPKSQTASFFPKAKPPHPLPFSLFPFSPPRDPSRPFLSRRRRRRWAPGRSRRRCGGRWWTRSRAPSPGASPAPSPPPSTSSKSASRSFPLP